MRPSSGLATNARTCCSISWGPSILIFETRSYTELEAHQFGENIWPETPLNLLGSSAQWQVPDFGNAIPALWLESGVRSLYFDIKYFRKKVDSPALDMYAKTHILSSTKDLGHFFFLSFMGIAVRDRKASLLFFLIYSSPCFFNKTFFRTLFTTFLTIFIKRGQRNIAENTLNFIILPRFQMRILEQVTLSFKILLICTIGVLNRFLSCHRKLYTDLEDSQLYSFYRDTLKLKDKRTEWFYLLFLRVLGHIWKQGSGRLMLPPKARRASFPISCSIFCCCRQSLAYSQIILSLPQATYCFIFSFYSSVPRSILPHSCKDSY